MPEARRRVGRWPTASTCVVALIVVFGVLACGEPPPPPAPSPVVEVPPEPAFEVDPMRKALFGDLHVRSSWSLDAYRAGVRVDPDAVFGLATAERIEDGQEGGFSRGRPLDFIAVTEQAAVMGVGPAALDPASRVAATEIGRRIADPDPAVAEAALVELASAVAAGQLPAGLDDPEIWRERWRQFVTVGQRHDDPGQFTAFVGYEWAPQTEPGTSHRVVIFAGDEVPSRPFTSVDSDDPEDLWSYLEVARETGSDALAISYDEQFGFGRMYPSTTSRGDPLDPEYARRRALNEPLHEIVQAAGQSESHPSLSPDDPWASFPGGQEGPDGDSTAVAGDYARTGLLEGVRVQAAQGFNPFRVGFVGSDGPVGGRMETNGDPDEPTVSQERPMTDRSEVTPGAGGLAGVWAESNTRASIFEAMRRRETFATTGPRIQVRFFGGWKLPDEPSPDDFVTTGYELGVPMGADLPDRSGSSGPPTFVLWAARDASSAPLDRIQLVKGWSDGETINEKIVDAVCAGGVESDAETGRCPASAGDDEPMDCTVVAGRGAEELIGTWVDTEFDPDVPTFYYARVLEVPSCRGGGSTLGTEEGDGGPVPLRERAVTSPIWYRPAS